MNEQILLYTAVALGTSLILTPVLRKIALKFGMVDHPNERKIHKEAVPYGGGIAIFLGFLLVFLIIDDFQFNEIGFIIGALIVLATVIYDDAKGLHAIPKLALQCTAAIVAIWFGLQFDMSLILRGNLEQFQYLAIPLTFLWIIGIINAVNLIDGLNGLAGG